MSPRFASEPENGGGSLIYRGESLGENSREQDKSMRVCMCDLCGGCQKNSGDSERPEKLESLKNLSHSKFEEAQKRRFAGQDVRNTRQVLAAIVDHRRFNWLKKREYLQIDRPNRGHRPAIDHG